MDQTWKSGESFSKAFSFFLACFHPSRVQSLFILPLHTKDIPLSLSLKSRDWALSDCCSLCWTFSCHNVDILKCKQLVKRETSSWIAFRFRGTREEWEDHLMPSEFCFPASTSTRFFRRLASMQLKYFAIDGRITIRLYRRRPLHVTAKLRF